MSKRKERIVVLKIGGSVITQKNREGVYIRRSRLVEIAQEIRSALKKDRNTKLIIIHGGGAGAHQLANKYNLKNGVGKSENKLKGSMLIRIANQKLNLELTKIFTNQGLNISPVHTASVIVQKGGELTTFAHDVIDQALLHGCIPLLYGEMVFDEDLSMSICSGDASSVYLAKLYDAEKILFASDVDGLYDKDPFIYKDATLIKKVGLKSLLSDKKIVLSGSHHIDVTGGLQNKIASVVGGDASLELKEVVIFNGLKKGAFKKAIEGQSDGTIISL